MFLAHNLPELTLNVVHFYTSDTTFNLPQNSAVLLQQHPQEWMAWMQEPPPAQMVAITIPLEGYAAWAPVRLTSGELFGLLVVIDRDKRDIAPEQHTLLESMAQRIAHEVEQERKRHQYERNQSEFVAIVSHEFRTALTSIMGFSQILREEVHPFSEVQEFANDIYLDADRIRRLISDMLDLERMQLGHVKLMRHYLQLNLLIAQLAPRVVLTQPAFTLQLELVGQLPILLADEDKIAQVISNLLTNAMKYSPNGGTIWIGTSHDGQHHHCWVRDQGMGIRPEDLESIFEKFGRVENASHRGISGTGLGLPIVREIARLHGGNAWAESTLGQGSTFHVTFAS